MRKNMKNILKMFFLLGVFALVQITPAAAWSVNNHHDIANKVYYNLPADVQEKLDLDAMRDGADDPDIKFFDFQNHQYPVSYQKAKYWLDQGKYYYNQGNYTYASYCFGVASHYISDTFSAPHSENERSANHALYEMRAAFFTCHISYLNGDLDSIMYDGYLEGKNSWKNWQKNGDDTYIHEDLDKGASASYTAILNSVG